jgi:hypothetical protein
VTGTMENTWIKKGLTGSTIKMIGVVLMVICHINQMFYLYGVPTWLDWFGRPVAIIFLFFCAEGFFHTRNRKKYMLQLLVGFELMNIVSFLLSRVMPSEVVLMNSIFGTLFLATVLMLAADTIRDGVKAKQGGKIAGGILLMLAPVAASVLVIVIFSTMSDGTLPPWSYVFFIAIPSFITTEGSFYFPLLGLLFYLLRKNRVIQLIPLAIFSLLNAVMLSTEWMAIFAAIPILLYNGKRGKGSKYFFYIFYPAHIYALYIISWVIGLVIN